MSEEAFGNNYRQIHAELGQFSTEIDFVLLFPIKILSFP